MEYKLSHINENGNVNMVDITEKKDSVRIAEAECKVYLQPDTIKLIQNNDTPKGNVLTTAEIAGIQAGKKTYELIPLCHNIKINKIKVDFKMLDNYINIRSYVKSYDKTGAEMEALTSVTVSALTIYDMLKAVDKTIKISDVTLNKKSGGKTVLMSGKIVSINISEKKGTAKQQVESGTVNLFEDFGIENDSHAKKGWIRQVSLLSLSSFNKMKSDKLNLKYGAFGENIDVSGVDVYKLPIGAKFLFNNGIELELTKIGKECHDKCVIYETVGDCVMPREGVFVKVNKPGKLEIGQEFKVVFNEN